MSIYDKNKKERNEVLLAEPTVATYDMGLQFDYISDKGAGTGLGYFVEWPAYLFRNLSKEKLETIKQKIKKKELSINDLCNTSLYEFVSENEELEDINDWLSKFLIINGNNENNIFCLYDEQRDEKPTFYDKEGELFNEFEERYMAELNPWGEMAEEKKEYWNERKEEIEGFYFETYE